LVDEILRTLDDMVAEATSGMREVEEGVALASEAEAALHRLTENARQIGDKISAIGRASEAMSRAKDELVGELERVAQVVDGHTAATEEIASTLTTVTQQVRDVATVSRDTSAAAEALASLVERLGEEAERVRLTAASVRANAAQLASVARAFRPLEESTGTESSTTRPVVSAAPAVLVR
jgi:methyl-accepting chemotaxis protein